MENSESSTEEMSFIDRYKKNLKEREDYRYFSVLLLALVIMTLLGFVTRELNFNVTLILFSSLYIASIYLCISLGLTMTYKLLNFANFAHAEYFVVGAYTAIAWTMIGDGREPNFFDIVIVIILSFFTAGLAAVIGDKLVFKPLRKKNSSPETLMISSLGWGIVVRNVISLFFGATVLYFRWIQVGTPTLPSFRLGGKSFISYAAYGLPVPYMISIVVTIGLVYGLFYLLGKTKTGKALRATSDNIDLAESSGIDTDRMINITWFIGGGLAGVSGVLFATSNGIIPTSGFIYLLPAFAVVVLGGVGSIKGSVYASLVIAFAQNLSASYLSWFEEPFNRTGLLAYVRVVPFFVLIVVILIKPEGIYGAEENE